MRCILKLKRGKGKGKRSENKRKPKRNGEGRDRGVGDSLCFLVRLLQWGLFSSGGDGGGGGGVMVMLPPLLPCGLLWQSPLLSLTSVALWMTGRMLLREGGVHVCVCG